jgi:hypothetical protein
MYGILTAKEKSTCAFSGIDWNQEPWNRWQAAGQDSPRVAGVSLRTYDIEETQFINTRIRRRQA